MTSIQLLIYALVIGVSCLAGVLIRTWIYYRRSKTIEHSNWSMVGGFEQINKKLDKWAPDLDEDFNRIVARLNHAGEWFENINKKLEPFEHIAKQSEFAKDPSILPKGESWWDTANDAKPFKISQN